MPNHFHLLLKQRVENQMANFMQSLSSRYSIFFNKNYKRKGPLYEDRYKAVLIDNDNQLLHLSRYLHQNPLKFWKKPLKNYPYSSYAEYLGLRNTTWINTKEILSFFKTRTKTKTIDFTSYESFVDTQDEKSDEVLLGLKLDN